MSGFRVGTNEFPTGNLTRLPFPLGTPQVQSDIPKIRNPGRARLSRCPPNSPARAPPRQGVGLHPGGASRPRRAACKGGPRLSGPWQVKKGHSFSTGFTGLTGFVDENRSVSRNPAQNSLCLSEQDSLRPLSSLWLAIFQWISMSGTSRPWRTSRETFLPRPRQMGSHGTCFVGQKRGPPRPTFAIAPVGDAKRGQCR